MNLSEKIKELERKRIISRKPNPIIPFLLAFMIFITGIITKNIVTNNSLTYALFFLSGFAFVFAIIHLIIVKILES